METQKHTINFYKLQAKKLKRELDIQHMDALNQVAKKYGFSNWTDCQRTFDVKLVTPNIDVSPISFTTWLAKQKNKDSPLGDLARDMLLDMTWPSYDDFDSYENYFYSQRAGWQGLEALKKAWNSYIAYQKQKLSLNVKKLFSKKTTIKRDIRKIIFVKNAVPIHYSLKTIEKFKVGDEAWISWGGRKAIPVIITEIDDRYYTFTIERPIYNAGNEHYLRLDEVRSTPELACINHVTL